jgi:hypothetical protein
MASVRARNFVATESLPPGSVTTSKHRSYRSAMYQKPEVKRFGSLRELTQGGGPAGGGDATNVYHRS